MAINPKIMKSLNLRLEKEEMDSFEARVGFMCDVSGSMVNLYRSGFMKSLNEILLAVGVRFDDNSEMDMAMFSNRCYPLPSMTEDNFENYVNDNIINSGKNIWGGTYFAPGFDYFIKEWFDVCIEEVTITTSKFLGLFKTQTKENRYIPREDQNPAYLIYQTDGELHDPAETEKLIKYANEHLNMFITFIGVKNGNNNFEFIASMKEKYQNVECVIIESNDLPSEDDLYDTIISDKVRDFFITKE